MKRLTAIAACAATAALLAPAGAGAQPDRESLLAKGAKRVTKAELKAALADAEIAGLAFRGGSIQWRLNGDGTIQGHYYDWRGNETDNVGKWRVSDKGQFCFEITSSGGTFRTSACQDWLKLGENFYALSDGYAQKRSVKKF